MTNNNINKYKPTATVVEYREPGKPSGTGFNLVSNAEGKKVLPEAAKWIILNGKEFNSDLVVFAQWATMKIRCPVPGCTNDVPGYWEHAGCGGTMEWSTDVQMRCNRCYSPSHVKNWSFSCHKHAGFQTTNKMSFSKTIANAARFRTINEDFAEQLLLSLENEAW